MPDMLDGLSEQGGDTSVHNCLLFCEGTAAMMLKEILRAKGSKVHTVKPDASLDDVVQKLVEHNCGSLVVCIEEQCAQVLGIITERDILRATASRRAPLEQIKVSEVMTRDLITGSPNDSIEHLMCLMTTHRIRPLPIIDGGQLCGIISIGDVVKSQLDDLSMENHYLKTYLNGDVDHCTETVRVAK